MLLIGLLTGKVAIGDESRLKQNYSKEKTDELRAEEDSTTNMKEAAKKLVELAGNKTKFEGMRCNVENKAVFSTFVKICLVHFCSSIELALHHIQHCCFRYFHRVRWSFMYDVIREQYRWLHTIGRFKNEVDTERGKTITHKGCKCK